MQHKPKPGDAFSFRGPNGDLSLIIEHVVLEIAEVRFLDDCRTRARIPLFVFTLERSISIDYFDGGRRPVFLDGPGRLMSKKEVSAYLDTRARELSEIEREAFCALADFKVDMREVEIKFLREFA